MKKAMHRTIFMIIVLILGTVLSGCREDSVFDGSKTGDDDHYDIDFEMLNTTYSHELDMKAGESIDVSVTSRSGKISIMIAKEKEEPIYRGSDMESSNFNVGIKEGGRYTVSVTGEKAKGHVVFLRRENPDSVVNVPTATDEAPTEPLGTPEAVPTVEAAPSPESESGKITN